MLIRLIILLLIVWGVILVLRGVLALRRQRSQELEREQRVDAEEMVLDPQCGSYLPKTAAIRQRGKYFCSRECANLYLSR
ncbi:MAG TPA: PP0621 family protein [Candidatus Eisenbacteria bacterium]|nr:PP0621 family protein [Candidatus Eisenbacteria bacterium]